MNNELINNIRNAAKNNTLESFIASCTWDIIYPFEGCTQYFKDGISLAVFDDEAPVLYTPTGAVTL